MVVRNESEQPGFMANMSNTMEPDMKKSLKKIKDLESYEDEIFKSVPFDSNGLVDIEAVGVL